SSPRSLPSARQRQGRGSTPIWGVSPRCLSPRPCRELLKTCIQFLTSVLHRPVATSFEGRHGSVRYWVKAELHRPWLLPVKLKKEFTVFEHIDINTPSLLSPQAGAKEKTLCCWFCTSGPISLSAKIERKGYTPGESIQIFAEIENCSSRMVVPKASIYQTQAFYAKGKMKEVKQLVYVDIPGAVDLFLNLPLVIGTIPLHPFGSRTSSVSSQGSMNMSWLSLILPERPEAPPSYAEVVTEEHRRSSLAPISSCDDFERVLQGPLFAYVQEFHFLPPPLYSEVGTSGKTVSPSVDQEKPFK
uniref:Arrestin domain-containing protein 3 n=1 Tax=Anser cygnoides TaxID=8845 RepID=A0A8B9EHG2_ANSCY